MLLLGSLLVSFGALALLLLVEDMLELCGFSGQENAVLGKVEEWNKMYGEDLRLSGMITA